MCDDNIDNNCNGLVDEQCSDDKEDLCKKLLAPSHSSANVTNGNLTDTLELFAVKGGVLSAGVRLSFSSLNTSPGPVGRSWSHSHDIRLATTDEGVVIKEGSGAKLFFTLRDGAYVSQPGDHSELATETDGSYRLTLRDGNWYLFQADGRVDSSGDRYGNALHYSYDDVNDLTGVTDNGGRTIILGYDRSVTPHRLQTVTDPAHNIYTMEYEGDRLRKIIHPPKDSQTTEQGYWEFTYTPAGHLETKRDPNGNLVSYEYHLDGQLKAAIDPEWNRNNSLDILKHRRSYLYNDETGDIKTTVFTEKDGGEWTYVYDRQRSVLLSKIDPDGKVTSYGYYDDGREKYRTDPFDGEKRLTTFSLYDENGNLTDQTEPMDLASVGISDAESVDPALIGTPQSPLTWAFHYTYDPNNYDRLTSSTDLRGSFPKTTSYTYTVENGGEVLTVTDPEQHSTVSRHNPNGTLKELVDGNGLITTYTYYPVNSETVAAGTAGQLWTVTNPDGVVTTFTRYDKNGNVLETTLTDTDGVTRLTTINEHDNLNRLRTLTRTTQGLPDNVTRYGYDLGGNMTSVTDAEGRAAIYTHTYLGEVASVTRTREGREVKTVFEYGTAGCASCSGGDRLTAVKDPNHVARELDGTVFQYDQLGRLEYETDPVGNRLHYTYYDNGLVKEKFDATDPAHEQKLVTHEYNHRGQLIFKKYPDGSQESYTYYPDGLMETATNRHISYAFTWYDNGWPESVSDSRGSRIDYELYDGIGRKKQITITDANGSRRTLHFDYDDNGRPWTVTSGAGTFTYHYDKLGRRDSLGYPNTTLADFGFDGLNRLTSLTHKRSGTPFADYTYPVHDQVGNRRDTTRNGVPRNHIYDDLYRLFQTIGPTVTEEFVFDDAGNRTVGPGAKDTGYSHDDANTMLSGRQFTYSHDTRGNQTARTIPGIAGKGWTLTWDNENRLDKVEKAKGAEKRTVTFQYDPLGRRIGKRYEATIDGVTLTEIHDYLYDGEDIVTETITADGTPRTLHYTHGPGIDEPLALEVDDTPYYYHADGLGSIVAITDGAGRVVQRYEYDSFGMVSAETEFENSYTYTGREWDKETGLYYYRARYYDPMEGRFISKDPIGFLGGINLYTYVQNNSINWTDPTGLAPKLPTLPPKKPGDGCGDAKTDCLVPDLYPGACKAHDECYSTPGKTKAQCDNEFFWNMVAESGPSPNVFVPAFYWAAVRFWGGSAFVNAQGAAR